jgi:sugar lactone lactonase YvrE
VRAGPGPPVSAAERRDAIAGLDRFVRMGGRVDASRIPARKPILATFVLDERDRIWAMMSRVAGDVSTRFEVFDPAGRHVRTVIVPARLDPFPTIIVRGGLLAGVERDEDGTERILLVRVPGPP